MFIYRSRIDWWHSPTCDIDCWFPFLHPIITYICMVMIALSCRSCMVIITQSQIHLYRQYMILWTNNKRRQDSHRSGKSPEKVKILESEEKVSKSWYVSGNFGILKQSGKIKEKWSWYQYGGLISSFDCQCHDVVAQSHSCQQEMQENREKYFHNFEIL